MTLASGRADRRRRILSDGRLAGDTETDTNPTGGGAKATGPRRYAPDASSVSFGVAGRVLPTGAWSLAGFTLAGVLGTAALVAGEVYRSILVGVLGERSDALLSVTSATSLAALSQTLLAFTIVGLCGVVFGLRRHRSDDLRGVYRWWVPATLASAAVAVCLTTGLHGVAASAIASRVGWSPLAGDAFWWMAPATLLLGGLGGRMFFDVKESRLATAGAVIATLSAGVAIVASQGWAPSSLTPHARVIEFAATNGFLLATAFALLAYARRIVLEAGGRAAAPVKRVRPAKQPKATKTEAKEEPKKPAAASRPAAKTETPRIASETAHPSSSTQWVDGSEGDVDDYGDDDSPRRKLSKAERKRLRRQKARENRAA